MGSFEKGVIQGKSPGAFSDLHLPVWLLFIKQPTVMSSDLFYVLNRWVTDACTVDKCVGAYQWVYMGISLETKASMVALLFPAFTCSVAFGLLTY